MAWSPVPSFTPPHKTLATQLSYHTLAQSLQIQTRRDGELDSLAIAFLGRTWCNENQLYLFEIANSHGHIGEQVTVLPLWILQKSIKISRKKVSKLLKKNIKKV